MKRRCFRKISIASLDSFHSFNYIIFYFIFSTPVIHKIFPHYTLHNRWSDTSSISSNTSTMSTFDSEGRPPRSEPLSLKLTTLPHPILDEGLQRAGAGDEWIASNEKSTNTPTPSTTDLIRTVSQTSQFSDYAVHTLGYRAGSSFPAAFHIFLRVSFYLLVLTITIGLSLAACKFTNIWDPCDHLYINRTSCTVTSYMKGMVYYTECTEEHSCILPGFESNFKRQGWTLHKPNDTGINSIDSSDNPTEYLWPDE